MMITDAAPPNVIFLIFKCFKPKHCIVNITMLLQIISYLAILINNTRNERGEYQVIV